MKTVLDAGGFDGCESMDFVESGDRWIIVDNQQFLEYDGWKVPAIPVCKAGVRAEYHVMDIMEWKEPADLVVCSNVLYHVENPWALLMHLHLLTKRTLILRTYFDKGERGWHYYGKEKPSHPHAGTAATIFYRPTLPNLLTDLNWVGWEDVKVTSNDGGIVGLECTKHDDIR